MGRLGNWWDHLRSSLLVGDVAIMRAGHASVALLCRVKRCSGLHLGFQFVSWVGANHMWFGVWFFLVPPAWP